MQQKFKTFTSYHIQNIKAALYECLMLLHYEKKKTHKENNPKKNIIKDKKISRTQ